MSAANQLQGTLFKYGPVQTHTAFVTGHHNRHVILVGGLGDGLLFAPYCALLAKNLVANGWSLVQTLLSSSYLSYGVESLDKDTEEIHLLAKYLRSNFDSKGLVLMGHSTGCQDTVRYARTYGSSSETPPVLGYILQACVSDREAQSSKPEADTRKRLEAAQLMVKNGEAEEIFYRDWEMRGAPIAARRFVALVAYDGDDDCFSSDFSDAQLKEKLGHMASTPSLLLMGSADECVPDKVDKELLVKRLAAAAGRRSSWVVIPSGRHNLTGREDLLVHNVQKFLASLQ